MPAGRAPTSIKAQFVYGGTDNGLCFNFDRLNFFCKRAHILIQFYAQGQMQNRSRIEMTGSGHPLIFQYPLLFDPIRVISPFPFSAANVLVIVRCDFPVFSISIAFVRFGSSRSNSRTECPSSLIRSFIWSPFWPDNGHVFRSILENSIVKSVSEFVYEMDTPDELQSL